LAALAPCSGAHPALQSFFVLVSALTPARCKCFRFQIESFKIREEEANKLLEIELSEHPDDMVLVISTDSVTPLPIAIQMHSLGWLGPYQVCEGFRV